MKRKKLVLTVVLVPPLAALALTVATVLFSQRPVETGLVDGRLRPCPDSPNCVSSQDEAAFIEPLAFQGDPQAAFQSLVDFVASDSSAEVLEVGDGYAHAVYWTPLLRFADDVELLLDPEREVVHVRSGSRVGRSDLGANRARVESIRARWRPAGAAGGGSRPTRD